MGVKLEGKSAPGHVSVTCSICWYFRHQTECSQCSMLFYAMSSLISSELWQRIIIMSGHSCGLQEFLFWKMNSCFELLNMSFLFHFNSQPCHINIAVLIYLSQQFSIFISISHYWLGTNFVNTKYVYIIESLKLWTDLCLLKINNKTSVQPHGMAGWGWGNNWKQNYRVMRIKIFIQLLFHCKNCLSKAAG